MEQPNEVENELQPELQPQPYETPLASKEDVLELKKDIGAVLEATKELVKLFGELKVFTEKWSKAGKF